MTRYPMEIIIPKNTTDVSIKQQLPDGYIIPDVYQTEIEIKKAANKDNGAIVKLFFDSNQEIKTFKGQISSEQIDKAREVWENSVRESMRIIALITARDIVIGEGILVNKDGSVLNINLYCELQQYRNLDLYTKKLKADLKSHRGEKNLTYLKVDENDRVVEVDKIF